MARVASSACAVKLLEAEGNSCQYMNNRSHGGPWFGCLSDGRGMWLRHGCYGKFELNSQEGRKRLLSCGCNGGSKANITCPGDGETTATRILPHTDVHTSRQRVQNLVVVINSVASNSVMINSVPRDILRRSLRESAAYVQLRRVRYLSVVGGSNHTAIHSVPDGSHTLEVPHNSIDFTGLIALVEERCRQFDSPVLPRVVIQRTPVQPGQPESGPFCLILSYSHLSCGCRQLLVSILGTFDHILYLHDTCVVGLPFFQRLIDLDLAANVTRPFMLRRSCNMGIYTQADLERPTVRSLLVNVLKGPTSGNINEIQVMKWKNLYLEGSVLKKLRYEAPCSGEQAPLCGSIWEDHERPRSVYGESRVKRKPLFCERLNLTKFQANWEILKYADRDKLPLTP